ncbi:MAG: AAA family ATPase, partial [Candidatus Bathyarchaeia archaeon]
MTKQQYKPLVTFTYSRRVKKLTPGRTKTMRFKGRNVKIYLEPDGRQLKVIDAPKQVIPELKKAETVRVIDGTLQAAYKKPEPTPKPPEPEPITPSLALEQPAEEKKEEAEPELKVVKAPKPKSKPEPEPTKPKLGKPKVLTEEERKDAMTIPVPMDRNVPIPAPYIDWDNMPESAKGHLTDDPKRKIVYHDYPIKGASDGLLMELRRCFARTRRYQDRLPLNVLIYGPKGTGKTQVVRKFAEEAGLPYWGTMGREGITTDELLGR